MNSGSLGWSQGWLVLSLPRAYSVMEGFLEEFLSELQKLGPQGTRGTQLFNLSGLNFLNKSWCRHPSGMFGGGFPGGQESSFRETYAAQNVSLVNVSLVKALHG